MNGTASQRPRSVFPFSAAWLLAYATVMALVSGGLAYGRQQAIAIYGSPEARRDWTTWRTDVSANQGKAPTSRRVPKSEEPPALVLMRDHFAVCLTGSLLLTTVLFAATMFLVRGAYAASSVEQVRACPRTPLPPGERGGAAAG